MAGSLSSPHACPASPQADSSPQPPSALATSAGAPAATIDANTCHTLTPLAATPAMPSTSAAFDTDPRPSTMLQATPSEYLNASSVAAASLPHHPPLGKDTQPGLHASSTASPAAPAATNTNTSQSGKLFMQPMQSMQSMQSMPALLPFSSTPSLASLSSASSSAAFSASVLSLSAGGSVGSVGTYPSGSASSSASPSGRPSMPSLGIEQTNKSSHRDDAVSSLDTAGQHSHTDRHDQQPLEFAGESAAGRLAGGCASPISSQPRDTSLVSDLPPGSSADLKPATANATATATRIEAPNSEPIVSSNAKQSAVSHTQYQHKHQQLHSQHPYAYTPYGSSSAAQPALHTAAPAASVSVPDPSIANASRGLSGPYPYPYTQPYSHSAYQQTSPAPVHSQSYTVNAAAGFNAQDRHRSSYRYPPSHTQQPYSRQSSAPQRLPQQPSQQPSQHQQHQQHTVNQPNLFHTDHFSSSLAAGSFPQAYSNQVHADRAGVSDPSRMMSSLSTAAAPLANATGLCGMNALPQLGQVSSLSSQQPAASMHRFSASTLGPFGATPQAVHGGLYAGASAPDHLNSEFRYASASVTNGSGAPYGLQPHTQHTQQFQQPPTSHDSRSAYASPADLSTASYGVYSYATEPNAFSAASNTMAVGSLDGKAVGHGLYQRHQYQQQQSSSLDATAQPRKSPSYMHGNHAHVKGEEKLSGAAALDALSAAAAASASDDSGSPSRASHIPLGSGNFSRMFNPPTASSAGRNKFVCPDCSTVFERLSAFRSHERVHAAAKARLAGLPRSTTTTSPSRGHLSHLPQLPTPLADADASASISPPPSLANPFAPHSNGMGIASHPPMPIVYKDRSYVCPVCTQSFLRHQDLKRHSDIKHPRSGEPVRRIHCDSCGRVFSRSDALFRHKKGRCKGPFDPVVLAFEPAGVNGT